MRTNKYSFEDLLLDETFILWAYGIGGPEWHDWVAKSEENKLLAERAKEIIRSLKFKTNNPTPEKIDELKSAIKIDILHHEYDKRQVRMPVWQQWRSWAAAIVLLFMLGGIGFFISLSNPFEEEEIEKETANTLLRKEVPYGQKLTIQLSDGSKVKLNAGSRLIYPEAFDGDKREVTLVGEAFFEVQKDPEKPFIIKSGEVKTTVLGTSFNIKAYEADDKVEVALVSGKVALERIQPCAKDSIESMILKPMQLAVLPSKGGSTLKTGFDYEEAIGWKDKIIRFKDTPFPKVLETLERWFGVTFVVQYDGNLSKTFTGRYENQTLKPVMEGISFSYGFDFTINENEDVVIIK